MKHLVVAAVVATLAGCAIQKRSPGMTPEQIATEMAMQRAGQAFVEQAYVRSGVIVTPSRNWYYGQTDGYANEVPPQLPARDWLGQAAADYGGVATGEVAEERGTGRSADERAALERLEAIGRFRVGGDASPIGGVQGRPYFDEQADRVAGQFFSRSGVLETLRTIDVGSLPDLPVPNIPDGFVVPVPRFDLGRHDVKLADRKNVLKGGAELAAYPVLALVTGFTDPSGTEVFNEGLADRRAAEMVKLLVAAGVPQERLLSYGRPKCCYLNDNSTDAKRAQNRRVEAIVGGPFVRADARDSYAVGRAVATVFKATGGDENFPIRVYGVAPDPVTARRLAAELKTLLEGRDVGHQAVQIGEASMGAAAELIIELVPRTRH